MVVFLAKNATRFLAAGCKAGKITWVAEEKGPIGEFADNNCAVLSTIGRLLLLIAYRLAYKKVIAQHGEFGCCLLYVVQHLLLLLIHAQCLIVMSAVKRHRPGSSSPGPGSKRQHLQASSSGKENQFLGISFAHSLNPVLMIFLPRSLPGR